MKRTKFKERFEQIRKTVTNVRPDYVEGHYRLLKNMDAIGAGITKKTYGAMLEKSSSTFKAIMEVIVYDRMKHEGKTKLHNYLTSDKGPLGHRRIEITPDDNGGLTFGLARKKHKLFNPKHVGLIHTARTDALVKQLSKFRGEVDKKRKRDYKDFVDFMKKFGVYENEIRILENKVNEIVNDIVEGTVDWEESDGDFSWQYNDTMGFFFVPESHGLKYDENKQKYYRENMLIDKHDPSLGTETRYYAMEDVMANSNFIENGENYAAKFKQLHERVDKLLTDPKLSTIGEYIQSNFGNSDITFADIAENIKKSIDVFKEYVDKYTSEYVGETRTASEFGELSTECVIDLNNAKQNVIKSLNDALSEYDDITDHIVNDPFTIADRGF